MSNIRCQKRCRPTFRNGPRVKRSVTIQSQFPCPPQSLSLGAFLTIFPKTTVAYGILYCLCVSLIKISILLFYYRLFGVRKAFKYTCYLVLALVICWSIAIVFSNLFQCIPVKAAWIRPYPHSKCINNNASLLGTAVTNVLLDVVILILPMAPVWSLSLTIRQKVTLTAIFLLGALYVSVPLSLCLPSSPSEPHNNTSPSPTASAAPPSSASGPSSTSTRQTSPGPTPAPSSGPPSKSQSASPAPASRPSSPSSSSVSAAAPSPARRKNTQTTISILPTPTTTETETQPPPPPLNMAHTSATPSASKRTVVRKW